MPRKKGTVLTPTEREVLVYVTRSNYGIRKLGGYGMAHYLRAARSLARRGLLTESGQSMFTLTDAGRLIGGKLDRRITEERKHERKNGKALQGKGVQGSQRAGRVEQDKEGPAPLEEGAGPAVPVPPQEA